MKNIALDGYFQCNHTPGFCKYKWRPINFSLVVENSGVKHVGKENADNLVASIQKHYPISVEWKGGLYYGIKLDWEYENRTVNLSMSGYV